MVTFKEDYQSYRVDGKLKFFKKGETYDLPEDAEAVFIKKGKAVKGKKKISAKEEKELSDSKEDD